SEESLICRPEQKSSTSSRVIRPCSNRQSFAMKPSILINSFMFVAPSGEGKSYVGQGDSSMPGGCDANPGGRRRASVFAAEHEPVISGREFDVHAFVARLNLFLSQDVALQPQFG